MKQEALMSVVSGRLIPKTLRYCTSCAKEMPHEIHEGSGIVALVCLGCAERELSYELDRE
jgi:hypothetical protein